MSRRVIVTNLSTFEKVSYYNDLPVEQNVLNAYMQMERKDFHWWDYDKREHPPIERCGTTFVCGDWSAFQDGHKFQSI